MIPSSTISAARAIPITIFIALETELKVDAFQKKHRKKTYQKAKVVPLTYQVNRAVGKGRKRNCRRAKHYREKLEDRCCHKRQNTTVRRRRTVRRVRKKVKAMANAKMQLRKTVPVCFNAKAGKRYRAVTENIALNKVRQRQESYQQDTIKPVRTQHFASATATTNMTAATAKERKNRHFG